MIFVDQIVVHIKTQTIFVKPLHTIPYFYGI